MKLSAPPNKLIVCFIPNEAEGIEFHMDENHFATAARRAVVISAGTIEQYRRDESQPLSVRQSAGSKALATYPLDGEPGINEGDVVYLKYIATAPDEKLADGMFSVSYDSVVAIRKSTKTSSGVELHAIHARYGYTLVFDRTVGSDLDKPESVRCISVGAPSFHTEGQTECTPEHTPGELVILRGKPWRLEFPGYETISAPNGMTVKAIESRYVAGKVTSQ